MLSRALNRSGALPAGEQLLFTVQFQPRSADCRACRAAKHKSMTFFPASCQSCLPASSRRFGKLLAGINPASQVRHKTPTNRGLLDAHFGFKELKTLTLDAHDKPDDLPGQGKAAGALL